jgi:hypothetical protein
MAEWTNSLIQAGVNTALAVTKSLPNLVMAGIAGALGALQIAVIAANMPKPPAFADGGVVGLPRTYHSKYANGGIVEANTPRGVDAVDTTLANREMVLNDDQQSNLFGAIAGGQLGGGVTTLQIQIMLDRLVIGNATVDVINDGLTHKIEARMLNHDNYT